jgi:hypothetical protein
MPDAKETGEAKQDPELQAIGGIVALLEPLDDDARERVVDYVFRRLGIELNARVDATTDQTATPPAATAVADGQFKNPSPATGSQPSRTTDIRSLRTQKSPGNAMEMAALVGYYLAHAAPKEERLDSFGTKELEKYFIQGGYPVPSTPRLVLFNAKKAGYLDVKSHGKYKVNAVGFNLVEHSLPARVGGATPGKSPPPRRQGGQRAKRR